MASAIAPMGWCTTVGVDGRPCCGSLKETKDRLTNAYLNLFSCHSLLVATLSRWTHVQICAATLCTGFLCRDMFLNALLHGLSADEQPESVAADELALAAAGAGDQDMGVEHRARVAKVRKWLALRETRSSVGCLFLMLKTLESLTYCLLGGGQEGTPSPNKQRPGTVPRWTPALPAWVLEAELRRALSEFENAVRRYMENDSQSSVLLQGIGVTSEELGGDQCMRAFRRYMVGASVGVYRRLYLRVSSFPIKLWLLVAPGVEQEARLQCAQDFVALPECCLGAFGRGLKKLHPTVSDLLSTHGLTTVSGWLSGMQWSTYGCEAEHASVRRLCSTAGPSRSWTLVARERIMEECRGIHMQRAGNAWPPGKVESEMHRNCQRLQKSCCSTRTL